MPATSVGTPRTVYYVSAGDGDNGNNGTTPSTAKATIGAAKTLANAGDLIVVGAGTYNERDLFKNGIEYHFELGSKVVYTGSAGALFDDSAGAGVCVIAGKGQFDHNGTGANRDVVRMRNASTITFEAISWESNGRGLACGNGHATITLEWASTGDGSFDVIDPGAVAIVHCKHVLSSAYCAEMDGGYLRLVADYIESTGSNPIEVAAGLVRIEGAEIVAPGGESCVVGTTGRLILHDCTLESSEDPVVGQTAFTVVAISSDVLPSEVTGLTEPVKRLNAAVSDLTANAITSVTAAGVTITPASSMVTSRAGANYVLAYTAETSSISITVLDAENEAVDLSGKTLGVYWEATDKTAVASLTSGITVTGASNNVVTFAIPSAVSVSERRLVFAVRDQSSPKTVYAGGVFSVQHLPSGT